MEDILINKEKSYIRFFMWVWEMGEEKLDQCRVFWGLLFFPIGLAYKFHNNLCFFQAGVFFVCCFFLLPFSLIFNYCLRLQLIFFGVGVVWLFIGYFLKIFTISLKKDYKIEKTLNKITIIGSAAIGKIQAFLGVIFYIPAKIILFFVKPVWKIIAKSFPLLGKLCNSTINNEKIKGFFRFAWEYIVAYKKNHCRKIKLIN